MISAFWNKALKTYLQKNGILTSKNTFSMGQQIEYGKLQTEEGVFMKLKSNYSFNLSKTTNLQLLKCYSQGTPIFVAIYNGFHKRVQQGQFFYLKNPNIQVAQGYIMVTINHQQDMVQKKSQNKLFEQYIKKGQQLMSNNQFSKAYQLYHEAIKNCKQQSEQQILLFKMAIVCYQLNLKEQYAQNIKKVLIISPHHEEALCHQIKSETISMKDCADPYKFQRLMQKAYNTLGIKESLRKDLISFIKFHETFQRNTNINWKQAFLSQNLGEYFSPKLEQRISEKGRGLYAKQKILKGQILIIQKPIISYYYEQKWSQTIYYMVGFREYLSPLFNLSQELKNKIKNLYSPIKYDNQSFMQQRYLQQVLKHNSFNDYQMEVIFTTTLNDTKLVRQNSLHILYDKICLINHQCEHNCERINVGSACIIFANHDIQQGEEISIIYLAEIDYKKRANSLQNWGIKCNCIMCMQQKAILEGKKIEQPKSVYVLLTTKKQLTSEQIIRVYSNSYYLNIICSAFMSNDSLMQNFGYQLLIKIFPMSLKQMKEVHQFYKK